MFRLQSIVSGIRALFRKKQAEREMDEELRAYLDAAVKEKMRLSMNQEEAQRAARVEMGSVDAVKEEIRSAGWEASVESLWQDVRYGVRQLMRNRGFTATVLLTLALGIGANTAIFSLANALLLKELPVKDPGRLVILTWAGRNQPEGLTFTGYSNPRDPQSGRELTNVFSYSIFKGIRNRTQTLVGLFVFAPLGNVNINDRGSGRSGIAITVSGNYFSALGIQAAAGRLLLESDDQGNAPCAAAISYRFWQTAFGGDPSIAGRTLNLNGRPCTMVGVTPRDFQGLEYLGFSSAPDVTVPITQGEQIGHWEFGGHLPLLTADNRWGLQIMGRLKPGIPEQQAQLETNSIFQQMLTSEWTSTAKEAGLPEIVLLPGNKGPNFGADFFAKPVTILVVIVTLLLMIACANVASLFLARGAARRKEFTVRLALGAKRSRLIRQLLTESVFLVSLGGAAGFLLAWWVSRYLVAFLPNPSSLNVGLNVSPDLRVFGFAAAISLISGIVFGLGPAVQSTRIDISAGLKDSMIPGGRARKEGRLWSRKFLVTLQLAISLLLVLVAGLLVRTLQNLKSADLGFDSRNVIVFGLSPTANGYTGEKLTSFYIRLLERLNALPGVVSASASSEVLISDMGGSNVIEVEGSTSTQEMRTRTNYVAPRFFETMGIPLLAGRGPRSQDTAGAPKVAIINATIARRCFPDTSPVGHRFRWKWGEKDWIEVVGVVGDAKFMNVRDEPPPTTYMPFLQCPWMSDMSFEVRAGTRTAGVAKEIYSAVRALDPDLPVIDMRTQEEQIDSSLNTERLFAELSGLFAVLGLGLACVGLYGILAYSVGRRTGEIGIRVALGANRNGILWLVLKQSLFWVLAGLLGGCLLALATTRLIKSLLYEIAPTNPVMIAGSVLLLFLVALLAAWIPARRATKVDPMVALRHE
ncbi:MAG TPA: ABC transporter permease [Terriglobia bacterium]|nr:ABC transporter permease [Terriglobia bacterium]